VACAFGKRDDNKGENQCKRVIKEGGDKGWCGRGTSVGCIFLTDVIDTSLIR
jgi:hypothetical protein